MGLKCPWSEKAGSENGVLRKPGLRKPGLRQPVLRKPRLRKPGTFALTGTILCLKAKVNLFAFPSRWHTRKLS